MNLSIVQENDEIYAIDPSRLTRSLKFMMELLDFAKEKKIKLVMDIISYDKNIKILCYNFI